ncbi:hypothetical protein RJ55_02979 [Drechmeria coniospora]|nr:hypothetical protein RJ55_02979 [Drechmeria coniospora]
MKIPTVIIFATIASAGFFDFLLSPFMEAPEALPESKVPNGSARNNDATFAPVEKALLEFKGAISIFPSKIGSSNIDQALLIANFNPLHDRLRDCAEAIKRLDTFTDADIQKLMPIIRSFENLGSPVLDALKKAKEAIVHSSACGSIRQQIIDLNEGTKLLSRLLTDTSPRKYMQSVYESFRPFTSDISSSMELFQYEQNCRDIPTQPAPQGKALPESGDSLAFASDDSALFAPIRKALYEFKRAISIFPSEIRSRNMDQALLDASFNPLHDRLKECAEAINRLDKFTDADVQKLMPIIRSFENLGNPVLDALTKAKEAILHSSACGSIQKQVNDLNDGTKLLSRLLIDKSPGKYMQSVYDSFVRFTTGISSSMELFRFDCIPIPTPFERVRKALHEFEGVISIFPSKLGDIRPMRHAPLDNLFGLVLEPLKELIEGLIRLSDFSENETKEVLAIIRSLEKLGTSFLAALTDSKEDIVKAGASETAADELMNIGSASTWIAQLLTSKVPKESKKTVSETYGQFSDILKKCRELFKTEKTNGGTSESTKPIPAATEEDIFTLPIPDDKVHPNVRFTGKIMNMFAKKILRLMS